LSSFSIREEQVFNVIAFDVTRELIGVFVRFREPLQLLMTLKEDDMQRIRNLHRMV
jgi:hypothetical protein